MKDQDRFLSEFTPLPESISLPDRILVEYEADSCLGHKEDGRLILNTQTLVQQITEAKLQGADSGRLAYLFHQTLAEQITAACMEVRNVSGRQKVALSGGVFQNRLLLRLTEERLMEEGFEVLRHRMVPPNDGGIAIGQAAYGMYQLQNGRV